MTNKSFLEYKIGEHVRVSLWGDLVECIIIGHDEPTEQVKLGYLPGCGNGSFYSKPDKLIEIDK